MWSIVIGAGALVGVVAVAWGLLRFFGASQRMMLYTIPAAAVAAIVGAALGYAVVGAVLDILSD